MSATMKFIHTRPSLYDLIIIEQNYNFVDTTNSIMADAPGFISGSYDELISAAEIKSRKAELEVIRPDLVEMLWTPEGECLLDVLIDPAHPFYVEGNFAFNPFVLTYTQSFTFDTLENLKNNYEFRIGSFSAEGLQAEKAYRDSIGTTLEQKVFDNGVDVTSSCSWLVNL